MNSDPLDRKLAVYAKQGLPHAPADMKDGVWQAIERRQRESFLTRLGWGELLRRPAWAIGGLAFALAIGVVPALTFSRAQQTKRMARDSLHLDVFSPRARGQPASLLVQPANSHSHSP